jgi:hypothetical protein
MNSRVIAELCQPYGLSVRKIERTGPIYTITTDRLDARPVESEKLVELVATINSVIAPDTAQMVLRT